MNKKCGWKICGWFVACFMTSCGCFPASSESDLARPASLMSNRLATHDYKTEREGTTHDRIALLVLTRVLNSIFYYLFSHFTLQQKKIYIYIKQTFIKGLN